MRVQYLHLARSYRFSKNLSLPKIVKILIDIFARKIYDMKHKIIFIYSTRLKYASFKSQVNSISQGYYIFHKVEIPSNKFYHFYQQIIDIDKLKIKIHSYEKK